FMRRVPSLTRKSLDADRTAEHIAALRLAKSPAWTPILRPETERWMEVEFIVDAAATMAPWRETVAELHRLLEGMGAFRLVRRWRLETDQAGGPLLYRTGNAPQVLNLERAGKAFGTEPG